MEEFQLVADLQPNLRGPEVTQEAYHDAVAVRYFSKARWVQRNARLNWLLFEEIKGDLCPWVEHYRRDPGFRVGDKWHNPDTTLTGMCWLAAKQIPALLDFEESFQTFFLRRGLIDYLKLLLREVQPMEVSR